MSHATVPVPGSSAEDNAGAAGPSAEPPRTDDFFSPSGRRGGRSEEQQFQLFQQFMRQHETRVTRREPRREIVMMKVPQGDEARVQDLHQSAMVRLQGQPLKIG